MDSRTISLFISLGEAFASRAYLVICLIIGCCPIYPNGPLWICCGAFFCTFFYYLQVILFCSSDIQEIQLFNAFSSTVLCQRVSISNHLPVNLHSPCRSLSISPWGCKVWLKVVKYLVLRSWSSRFDFF